MHVLHSHMIQSDVCGTESSCSFNQLSICKTNLSQQLDPVLQRQRFAGHVWLPGSISLHACVNTGYICGFPPRSVSSGNRCNTLKHDLRLY